MELSSYSTAKVKVLTLSGSFDTYSSSPARQWLEQATKTPPPNIVVDLQKVPFLDSTALSTLVQGMKRSRELSGDLRLCGLQPPVRMIFELTRLDKVFEIYIDAQHAEESFGA